MWPLIHRVKNSPNAPRNLQTRLAVAFGGIFGAVNKGVWTLLILLLAQVICSEATTKQETSSCSQIGKPETNVTLLEGLDNPKVHRFILGHVKTLEECVQIACRRENLTLAYISRFDCFGISCDGDEETCWLLPSFQNPTLVFARLQRGIPKVQNTTTNKAGKLSKLHPKHKHEKKRRNADGSKLEVLPSVEEFSSKLNLKGRSKYDELSVLAAKTRSKRNAFFSQHSRHEISRKSVRERPHLELPYLWKRRRKPNQRFRKNVNEVKGILGRKFFGLENNEKKKESDFLDSNSYFDSNKPLDRHKRDIEEDETLISSERDAESGQTGFSGSGNEKIDGHMPAKLKDDRDVKSGQSGSGNDVNVKRQNTLQRYKRDFDDDDDWADDSTSFHSEEKLKDEQQDNEVQRYKRKLDDDDDDDKSSADANSVWSSGITDVSDSHNGLYSGYNEAPTEESDEGNSLRRYKRKALEPEEMDELSKALSSSSPSKTKTLASPPSFLSSPSPSSASSSSTTLERALQGASDKETKTEKDVSSPIKKISAAFPQETSSSSSSSASISISSVPQPPPPPPSSTSSSSSISVTSTSTGSLPGSQTSSTKVSSSSTTFPKASSSSKKKDAPISSSKSTTKVPGEVKKASAVPPQDSVSSSSSASISISSVPPPPPSSTSSSSSISVTSTSTGSLPGSQTTQTSTQSSSSTTFPKASSSSKKKDAPLSASKSMAKMPEKDVKKASAVPPQDSVSSSSSASISISSVPQPPPPPPSSTSSSSSISVTSTSTGSLPGSQTSSTKVSSSSTTFPKASSSSKKKDAPISSSKNTTKVPGEVKKASAVPPQDSASSSSSSSSISISSVPQPPPPPPPSSSSSSSISVTSTSTGSLPGSQTTQTSTTKVSSSSTFPKTSSSKKKDVSTKLTQKEVKKASAVPPQVVSSSSSSSSISISSVPPPPPPPPPPSSTSSSSSISVTSGSLPGSQTTQTSSTKVSSSSTTFPKASSSSKKKDAPLSASKSTAKTPEKDVKKASAVPPQDSVSSSSSASISILSVPQPPPPPPPPSTTSSTSVTTSNTQPTTSTTKVSTSTSTFPKVKSSKTKDASKKHVKKAPKSSAAKLSKSSHTANKTSSGKSKNVFTVFSHKKEKFISKKSKQMTRSRRTSPKGERNEKGKKRKAKVDEIRRKDKRQASYGTGWYARTSISGYNSIIRPALANSIAYNRPKASQATLFKSLQQNGPLNIPSYTGIPRNGYQGVKALNQFKQGNSYILQGGNNQMMSAYHRPVVSSVGVPSVQPYPASKTRVPFRSIISKITPPSLKQALPQPRSFGFPTNYAPRTAVRANNPQIQAPTWSYEVPYGSQSTLHAVLQNQDGNLLTAQMKSHIPDKPGHYAPMRPGEQINNNGQGLNGKSCDYALGMQDGRIKDEQLSSSSDFSKYHSAARGRLGNSPKQNGLAGAWCSGANQIDRSQYLQIDLGQRRRVCGLATQGMPEFPIWVKEYTLEFSNNGHIWADYTEEGREKIFEGNKDSNTPVNHFLKQPITARFIRFKPQSWNGASICMRAEVYSSTDPGLTSRDQISKQGLVVYLNFDKGGGSPSESRRTDISRAPGVCGGVATLRNGNTILLDGRKIQPKPRDAITIAAWIRLDNTSGQHSIFDSVGGHSSHDSGQYHFEVSDGKLRWYHRNETADQIFSVESDAVVTPNTWTHVAGTYDSHTGISKVYIDGHVNGQAQGSGLLSQDWDSHVGIGKHKDSRFLDGMVDEFRIYDYAMEEPEIKKLKNICDYAKSCGGSFDTPTGIIESPNWPDSYKDSKTCIWKITVDKTDKIALNFEKFALQEDGNCDKSRLVIKDGEDKDAKEIGQFCGLNSPRVMISTGNNLWLQFTSTPEGEGKGFRLTYQRADNRQTKKEERPGVPVQNMKCSASTPEYNVTLSGGINAGSFSEALGVNSLDMCMRQCCLKDSCDLAFMISDSCYLVKCKDEESCKTKKARPSGMKPTIVYITHLHEQPHTGLTEEETLLDQPLPRPTPPPSQCHHTDVTYNVTLVGGIKAGKFNTYGHMSSIDDCIRHCCHDDNCDVVFMIQNNCYNVECANSLGCQMKKAKPSPYNPTLVYVYRGDTKPIAVPTKKFDKPARSSCHALQVSHTLHNVTLIGGIKSGNFTDKGVVNDIEECKAYCCAEDSCNVAFLIRTNCFLVACKDYESCKVKPALSDYYHPKLAYVNWYPPDEEVGPNDKFASLGCWRDTDSFAIPSLEGTDPLLTESYKLRAKPIDTCANVAFKRGYKVFGIHRGGACFSGPKAEESFNKFGESADCKNGRGGVGATDVYRLDQEGKYSKLGCWRDSENRALEVMEHTDPRLNDFYQTRTSPIAKCAEVAKQQGYPVFAIQDGGECLSGPTAEDKYNKYGVSRDCRGKLGSTYANSVYKLIGNFDIEDEEAANTSTATNGTENSSNKNNLFKPENETAGIKQVIGDDLPTNTDTSMKEDFVTMKNGKPKRIVYTAGKIQYNITLKFGIRAGKFMDKGHVENVSQCISSCGRQPDCDLAFMLGQQCFAVSCKSKAFCVTKPAFSAFYNPMIVFVTHRKIFDTAKAQRNRCHMSTVQNDVTLIGGINAGKFIDFGPISDINACIKRCCAKSTCDVAFKLEDQCYGVSCISNKLCETRAARNPGRYKPQIAYVYHDRKGLDRVQDFTLTTNDSSHELHMTKTDKTDLNLIHNTRTSKKENTTRISSTTHDRRQDTAHKILDDSLGHSYADSERNKHDKNTLVTVSSARHSHGKTNGKTHSKVTHQTADTLTTYFNEEAKGAIVNHHKKHHEIKTNNYQFDDVKGKNTYGNSIAPKGSKIGIHSQNGYFSFVNIHNNNDKNHKPTATNNNNDKIKKITQENKDAYRQRLLADFVKSGERTNQNIEKADQSKLVIKGGLTNTTANQTDLSHVIFSGRLMKISPIDSTEDKGKTTFVKSNDAKEINFSVMSQNTEGEDQNIEQKNPNFSKYVTTIRKNEKKNQLGLETLKLHALTKPLNHLVPLNGKNNVKTAQNQKQAVELVALRPDNANILSHFASLQENNKHSDLKTKQNKLGLVALGPNSQNVVIKPLKIKDLHVKQFHSLGQITNINGHGLHKISLAADDDVTMTTNEQTGHKQIAMSLVNPERKPQKSLSTYIHFVNALLASNDSSIQGDSNSTGSVCWDGDVLYNQTLIGGINAGVFTDNGKTTTMDLCMQSCCKQQSCDLAFMIEDDCYSVACTSPSSCKTRVARPTQFYPRISLTNRFKDLMSKETTGLTSGTSAPHEPSTQAPTQAATSVKVATTVQPRVQSPTLKVQHSCSATPIKYNVTLRMGLHSGLFTKMGRVDSMDDCIELNCKQDKADVAFMMGTHCYAVQCYSEELCKTEPVFATSFSFLNLRPAVSFLRKNPGSSGNALAQRENPRENCLESTITYNVTLRGGIHAGKFTERPHVHTMRACISECCDAESCDLAFMFGNRCYSVTCKSERSCQAVLAKPTSLNPKIAYMSRSSPSSDGLTLAESEDVHPKCHADDISKSVIARNKTLAGGLEAGTFRFLGKVKSMGFCMHMCCARPRCDVAYLIDKNCFSITCFSPELCRITSDKSYTNGDVEISAMLKSVKKDELPEEPHSVVVYIIVGTLLFAAGLGGIVWAVCMFLRRHRLRQRHRTRSPSDG